MVVAEISGSVYLRAKLCEDSGSSSDSVLHSFTTTTLVQRAAVYLSPSPGLLN